MELVAGPFYLDWQFWSAIAALLAIVLSQLPPIVLWFRPRRLEVEVHSRIQITHWIGNPNLGMVVSIQNTGGRTLRIRSISMSLRRDDVNIGTFPVQNYFETPSAQTPSLFVPFELKPGDSWAHGANFLRLFDRATEKLFREKESVLRTGIREKLDARPKGDESLVVAAPENVKPLLDLFEKLFVWQPGEYSLTLMVEAYPGSASYSRKYRFTLYESDSAELRSHTDEYKYGGGVSYKVDRHVGLFIPLTRDDG